MAKLFIGIALVVMLATAALSFLAKGNIDKLQSSLKETKATVTTAEAKAKTAKSDADKAQKEAKEAAEKAETAAQTATAKTQEAAEQKKAADEAKLVIESKDKEIAALNEKMKNPVPGGVDPATVDQLKAQVQELTTQKDNAAKETAEAKAAFDSLVAKGKDNEQKLADIQKKEKQRELGVTKPGLQGRILAVNSGWNFVVLSVGDKQGVTINAPLLVVRGNEPIARLRITSVEPTTSIADVLPGTVRRGISVQPGDTVIFEGARSQPGVKSAPDAPLTTPVTPVIPALPNN